MCIAARVLRKILVLIALLFAGFAARAEAEHVSLWGGGGIGTLLAGGAGAEHVNGHKMGMLAISLPHDNFQVRLLKGSLERTRAIPTGTGDNDLDYEGIDLVITRKATDFPVALAIGVARYEEAYHVGYPHQDLGGSEFVHRWGPHVSALRSWRFGRFFEAWAEADLHHAPYRPSQLVLFLDIGVGVHF
jgi:hypothetical protein